MHAIYRALVTGIFRHMSAFAGPTRPAHAENWGTTKAPLVA